MLVGAIGLSRQGARTCAFAGLSPSNTKTAAATNSRGSLLQGLGRCTPAPPPERHIPSAWERAGWLVDGLIACSWVASPGRAPLANRLLRRLQTPVRLRPCPRAARRMLGRWAGRWVAGSGRRKPLKRRCASSVCAGERAWGVLVRRQCGRGVSVTVAGSRSPVSPDQSRAGPLSPSWPIPAPAPLQPLPSTRRKACYLVLPGPGPPGQRGVSRQLPTRKEWASECSRPCS